MITTQTTTTINLAGQVSVAELNAILDDLPGSALVTFQNHPPDRPGVDAGYTSLTVRAR